MEKNIYKKCSVCPRNCGADRTKAKGFCGETDKIRIARAALHYWEEPCISGKNGSGAVFFSGCQLKCVYCQNKIIASGEAGKEISPERLKEIFFELKEKQAENINLITCDHFMPTVAEVILEAKKEGIGIPFVLNTSGYVKEDVINSLDGIIDVYLPDFKYFSPFAAKKYSFAADYPETAKRAIDAMAKQIRRIVINSRGIMEKGLIVRHLVLPGHTDDSKKVIRYLYEKYGDKIYISIMNQYTPCNISDKYPELSRKLYEDEYNSVVNYAQSLGISNAYIQEGETADESFIPAFDYEGVENEQR